GDGVPEVIAGAQIFRATDGMEITPAALQAVNSPYGAYAGVADFNLDGKPELALVYPISDHARKGAIYDWAAGKFLLDPGDARQGWGSAPTVADFDGDGVPEMAVAGVTSLVVYSPACAMLGMGRPPRCDPNGLAGEMWSRPIQDFSSGSSGVAAF